MTTDLTKPVQTADGRKARVICTDRDKHEYPVLALIARDDGGEWVYAYDLLGIHGLSAGLTLINIDTTPNNLRVAREAAAQMWEEKGYPTNAKNCRTGMYDGWTEIRAILKALEMVA